MPIEIKLVAETSEELRTLLKGVAYLLSGQITSTVQSIHEPEAVMTVETRADDKGFHLDVEVAPVELVEDKPAAKRRGRPPKAKVEDEPVVVDNSDVAEAMETTVTPPDEAEVYKNAMSILKDIFNNDPKGSEKIRRIQKKYGVLKLGDIPVERAGELWTDADALANEAA